MSECKRCLQLEDELFQLKDDLGLHNKDQVAALQFIYKITRVGAEMLNALYYAKGRVLTREFLYGVTSESEHNRSKANEFNTKIVDVYICKLRKALREPIVTMRFSDPTYIELAWGKGYNLTSKCIARIADDLAKYDEEVLPSDVSTRFYINEDEAKNENPYKIRYRGKLYLRVNEET